jgi:hypothetical protein
VKGNSPEKMTRPRTKTPDRRFAARTALPAAVAVLLALIFACTSDASPAASPTPTLDPDAPLPPLPTADIPTPTPEPSPVEEQGLDGFRAFAIQIQAALTESDTAFFASRGLEDELTCAGDEVLGICSGQRAGRILRGIPSAIYQSDAFALLSEDEYAGTLDEWLASAATDGHPTLRALAHRPAAGDEEEVYMAIAKGVFVIGPEGEQVRRQQGRVFEFQFVDGSWRLSRDLYLSVPESTDVWLSGDCDECYDQWEHWRPTAPQPTPTPTPTA